MMDRKGFEQKFIGRIYTEAKTEMGAYDWSGLYPVVSQGKIVAILDCSDSTDPYAGKPIRDDSFIDADALDEEG